MKKLFLSLPKAVQRKLLARAVLAAVSFVASIVLCICLKELNIVLPFIGMTLFFALSALWLMKICATGECTVICGICVECEKTPVRKLTKCIVVKTDAHLVRIAVQNRHRKISVGSDITVYLANKTPVYERDGAMLVMNYIALEVASQ